MVRDPYPLTNHSPGAGVFTLPTQMGVIGLKTRKTRKTGTCNLYKLMGSQKHGKTQKTANFDLFLYL